MRVYCPKGTLYALLENNTVVEGRLFTRKSGLWQFDLLVLLVAGKNWNSAWKTRQNKTFSFFSRWSKIFNLLSQNVLQEVDWIFNFFIMDSSATYVQHVSYTGKLFLMTSVANWQQKLRNASVRGFFLTYCLIGLPAYLLTETNKWKSILSMSSDFWYWILSLGLNLRSCCVW